ncbi:MAG: phosphoenolpyruvate synthase [Dehalococcoidales bacterium]|nr:phosphoenolpyruvate synthase [Dehalococcoidales bacterium]
MPSVAKTVVWFEEVTKGDIAMVGGKGANLGEMTNARIPVPNGFIVTSQTYFDFLDRTKLTDQIRAMLQPLDINNSKALQQISAKVKQVIHDASMPEETAQAIREAYRKLGDGPVAVRSSATAEDLPDASFAGQQSTFLNIQGEDAVVQAVKECWASLFEARAIFYRVQQHFDHFKVGIAVPVQTMIQSTASGVMFTLEPVTSDRSKILIEAIFGLGEAIVGGEVKPDFYVIDKAKMAISLKKVSHQDWQLTRNPDNRNSDTNIHAPIPPEKRDLQKITDEDILKLAKLGKQIEEHYKFPQDIEWAKEDGKIFILQTRPITTIKENVEEGPEISAPVILTGNPASPGVASGPVRILVDASEIDKINEGDILVASMTTPDFVPAMKRAVAIVTDRGGRTAHAAIVSRELGIPCIVGAEKATKMFKDGQIITVDGTHGKIYEGKVTRRVETSGVSSIIRETLKTKTRIYVNLAQPELAEKVAAHNVDGVGLLRAEFMIAHIGEHPRYMIDQNRSAEFVSKLAQGISIFTKAFNPRPVVYRTNDLKSNEYRKLHGGEKYERDEENPMLGYRGASRYIVDLDVFKLELEAIKKVRETYKNLNIMIPFVRTVNELARTKEIIESSGLKRSGDFKIWMMVEVPSNIFLIEKFISVGIDGISIGSNDLTQLILGVDRDNERLREAFDERDEAVMVALEKAVKTARSMGITSSICGQAPSVYPELTEKLVEWGITSVSVSPDMIGTTREIIAKAEQRLGIRP